jgi:multidrug transporter EmrE-like cation transporter
MSDRALSTELWSGFKGILYLVGILIVSVFFTLKIFRPDLLTNYDGLVLIGVIIIALIGLIDMFDDSSHFRKLAPINLVLAIVMFVNI